MNQHSMHYIHNQAIKPMSQSSTKTKTPQHLTSDSSSSSTTTTTTIPTSSPSPSSLLSSSLSSSTSVSSAYYLLFYNVCMTAGWMSVLYRLCIAIVRGKDVYNYIALPLKVFQTGAILEIVHAATRLIGAHPFITALQVGSRLMLLWGVVQPVLSVRKEWYLTTMVLSWSLTEIPRYFYFSISSTLFGRKSIPFWIVFTRYSTFIPLYPLGAGSEWFTLFNALPYIKQSQIFSISLPNRFNFAFDYYIYCCIILFLYIPGLPYMYSHMLRQRRKYVIHEQQEQQSSSSSPTSISSTTKKTQ